MVIGLSLFIVLHGKSVHHQGKKFIHHGFISSPGISLMLLVPTLHIWIRICSLADLATSHQSCQCSRKLGLKPFGTLAKSSIRRRLEKRIYIPLPKFERRKELIRINLRTVEVIYFANSIFSVIVYLVRQLRS
ncbi:PREDICTED: uncharacterized protein LOC104588778 [Nelumbo nucifera]|uniref:Uncharacterized protein LOC104588778 n=1 Tax=Nelumbo nucifera TaxID=4432 RepID=A0A1U7YZS0_NELNU|nr:PREDICTED: uncharacterized protein LOC104588778 [Nelumbo nucifera]